MLSQPVQNWYCGLGESVLVLLILSILGFGTTLYVMFLAGEDGQNVPDGVIIACVLCGLLFTGFAIVYYSYGSKWRKERKEATTKAWRDTLGLKELQGEATQMIVMGSLHTGPARTAPL